MEVITLKSKKIKNILAISGICAMLFFSVVAFPFILAASPENRELETLETETAFPAEEAIEQQGITEQIDESEQPDTPEPGIDINAISEEMALEIAKKLREQYGEEDFFWEGPDGTTRGFSREYIEAKYMASSDTAGSPSWLVLVRYRFWGEVHFDLRDAEYNTLEELIAAQQERTGDAYNWTIGQNNRGVNVAKGTYDDSTYFIVEINAFTGEYIHKFELKAGITCLDGISTWEELMPHVVNIWEIVPVEQPVEPTPAPGPASTDPEPTPEPTSMPYPAPTPEPYPVPAIAEIR